MSKAAKKCEKGKDPRKCTPKEIRECHGVTARHTCATSATKKSK